jgi:hypothetical protein
MPWVGMFADRGRVAATVLLLLKNGRMEVDEVNLLPWCSVSWNAQILTPTHHHRTMYKRTILVRVVSARSARSARRRFGVLEFCGTLHVIAEHEHSATCTVLTLSFEIEITFGPACERVGVFNRGTLRKHRYFLGQYRLIVVSDS